MSSLRPPICSTKVFRKISVTRSSCCCFIFSSYRINLIHRKQCTGIISPRKMWDTMPFTLIGNLSIFDYAFCSFVVFWTYYLHSTWAQYCQTPSNLPENINMIDFSLAYDICYMYSIYSVYPILYIRYLLAS